MVDSDQNHAGAPGAGDSEDELITLVDDEGHEHDFTLIDVVEVDQQRYAVLLPEEDPEEGAYVFRLETDPKGEEVLVNVEDDSEFDRVVHALEQQDDEDDLDDDEADEADESDDFDEDWDQDEGNPEADEDEEKQ